MSLTVYTDKTQIPKDMKFVNYNDKFFMRVALKDTESVRDILATIDKAEYHTQSTFIGRDKELGAMYKENLSTGCKILLNITMNPDICFDVIECGPNALEYLAKIRNGNVYWGTPVLHMIGTSECDIIVHGLHFTDFKEFLGYVMVDMYNE